MSDRQADRQEVVQVKNKKTKDKDTGHKMFRISLPLRKQKRRKRHLRKVA